MTNTTPLQATFSTRFKTKIVVRRGSGYLRKNMDVGLLKYSYSYKWDHIITLHPPKICMEPEHDVFLCSQHFRNLVGLLGVSVVHPGSQSHGGLNIQMMLHRRWFSGGRWQVVSRWFQVFPGIFTLLGGWCSCSILRRLFCFQVAQPPTRISSNLIQWDVPNPRSGKTIFLPWMGYLNVYSPKILGRAALWMFYFDA